jgi:DNA polymerase-3 subunit alpha
MYLNCHSCYSYRYGTLSEEELLQLGASFGVRTMALTDINHTSAILNFIRLAPKYQIDPVAGIDFRNGVQPCYIGLALNNEGFRELNDFLSEYKHTATPFPNQAPMFENALIIYPFTALQQFNKTNWLPNEYIGLSPQDLLRFSFSTYKHEIKRCVALLSVSFGHKQHFNTHRLLRAIDNNTLLSKLPLSEQAGEQEMFLPLDEIKRLYHQCPELLQRSEQILNRCKITFDFSPNKPSLNLRTYCGNMNEDLQLLKSLCREGLKKRYPQVNETIQNRLQKELDMIEKMHFVSFFLVNWDIIRYAAHKGYYHVGRGSGANSIVAYLLGITDVDPIELDLYFERFMNLYRVSPPDFDIDFSTRDRPDMTRYIFERFGQQKQVALLAAYSTFQYSAAVRELGKVFGLPKQEIDLLSDGRYDATKLDHIAQLILLYAKRLENKPNYLTVHAAGILIADQSIHHYTATDLPPKGFPTTHFDMYTAEDVGLHKFDILGQRGLGKIKDTLTIIRENHPEAAPIDIHDTRPMMQDARVNALVRSSQCIGCFYVESPAMRTLIKKLEVDNYLALVAASSIIRPGVSQSGMMREYILRHKDPERRKTAHPVMMDLMPETYGVMVYQEDVIKVAHHFAGLSLGEADVLRRGMSGKFRSREEFQKVQETFLRNCRSKGYSDSLTHEVWSQIESFAGYAFAKGHSASYAVESYQSLYLKTYYPREYMVAVLNNGGGFYHTELYVHEARMCGANIVTCCVNEGLWASRICGKTIRLGFQHILNIEHQLVQDLIAEREAHGPFSSLHDFLQRIQVGIEQVQLLIRIGAFSFTGKNKRALLWEALFAKRHEPKAIHQYLLFERKPVQFTLPDLQVSDLENAFDEMELFGFSLCDPFLLGKDIQAFPQTRVADLPQLIGKTIQICGYLITIKNTRTIKGEYMQFCTFIDRDGHWIDSVHFPQIAKQFPFRGKGLYLIQGMVKDDFGALIIETTLLQKIPMLDDPRYVDEHIAPQAHKHVAPLQNLLK